MSKKIGTRNLTQIALIAAIYAAITLLTFYMSFGTVQYRISEVLTILPLFTLNAVPGLTIGCFLANIIGFFIGVNPTGILDCIFGTCATLIASIITYYIGKSSKKWIKVAFGPFPAVILNAIIVGWEICRFFIGEVTLELFLINAGLVGLGQLVVCYVMGIPVMLVLYKNNLYQKIFYRKSRLNQNIIEE